jgi:hypothetical protein
MVDEDAFRELAVRQMVLRDIVTRLLASHALGLPDPDDFLKALSEQGTQRATTLSQSDHQAMRMAEAIQNEFDAVVARARALVVSKGDN